VVASDAQVDWLRAQSIDRWASSSARDPRGFGSYVLANTLGFGGMQLGDTLVARSVTSEPSVLCGGNRRTSS
jgi:hypothetical protein